MTTCPHCGGTRIIGIGELSTCAGCGRFALTDNGLPSCFVADRLRAEMTTAEQRIEFAIRRSTYHPVAIEAQA